MKPGEIKQEHIHIAMIEKCGGDCERLLSPNDSIRFKVAGKSFVYCFDCLARRTVMAAGKLYAAYQAKGGQVKPPSKNETDWAAGILEGVIWLIKKG